MELKEAFWEKRNLGMDTLEIDFDNKDVFNTKLGNILSSYKHIVAKIPCGNIKLIHRLEDKGFRFMETQICFSKILDSNYETPENFKRIAERISIKQILSEYDLNSILNEISKGMFETDRIALDMYFGINYAAKRYYNWVNDEFAKKSSRLFELVFCNSSVGFFLIKSIDNKASIVLGGVYRDYRNFGLGFSFIDKAIKLSLSEDKSLIMAKVSSNNLPILKLYSAFGFSIIKISYVMRRIIN